MPNAIDATEIRTSDASNWGALAADGLGRVCALRARSLLGIVVLLDIDISQIAPVTGGQDVLD
jgi:hypothetical protein